MYIYFLKWHEDEDRTKYCSLSIVRNYAYIISDMCCEHYGLRLLPNRHCPASIADESKYEIKPPADPRKPDDVIIQYPILNFPRILILYSMFD